MSGLELCRIRRSWSFSSGTCIVDVTEQKHGRLIANVRDLRGKIRIGRKKMIKEYISTPQALALAVMVFTLGLKTPVRDETALNVITILWLISMVVLWALM